MTDTSKARPAPRSKDGNAKKRAAEEEKKKYDNAKKLTLSIIGSKATREIEKAEEERQREKEQVIRRLMLYR